MSLAWKPEDPEDSLCDHAEMLKKRPSNMLIGVLLVSLGIYGLLYLLNSIFGWWAWLAAGVGKVIG